VAWQVLTIVAKAFTLTASDLAGYRSSRDLSARLLESVKLESKESTADLHKCKRRPSD